MMAGLQRIPDILQLYRIRESIYISAPGNRGDFQGSVIALYRTLLEYQVRVILYLQKHSVTRAAQNLTKMDDWKAYLSEIQKRDDHCIKVVQVLDSEQEQEQWRIHFGHLDSQTKVLEQISGNFQALLEQQQRMRHEGDATKCLQALSTDYDGQKNFNPQRVPGTCEWFLRDKRFLEWQNHKASSLLWVSADPGCGKSVLSRCLIDEAHLSSSVMASTTGFFFFKEGQEGRTTASDALAAVLHRVFDQNPSTELINHAIPSWKSRGQGLRGMFGELWSILMKVAKDPNAGEVICLIDALDECEEESRK